MVESSARGKVRWYFLATALFAVLLWYWLFGRTVEPAGNHPATHITAVAELESDSASSALASVADAAAPLDEDAVEFAPGLAA
jgi:hypothetical protein